MSNTYKCPKCAGLVEKVPLKTVMVRYRPFRWTCRDCHRDYGYNTDRPLFDEEGDSVFITRCRVLDPAERQE